MDQKIDNSIEDFSVMTKEIKEEDKDFASASNTKNGKDDTAVLNALNKLDESIANVYRMVYKDELDKAIKEALKKTFNTFSGAREALKESCSRACSRTAAFSRRQ